MIKTNTELSALAIDSDHHSAIVNMCNRVRRREENLENLGIRHVQPDAKSTLAISQGITCMPNRKTRCLFESTVRASLKCPLSSRIPFNFGTAKLEKCSAC